MSTPVTWEELDGQPPRFSVRTIGARMEQVGDLFAPMLGMAQDLRRATAELRSML